MNVTRWDALIYIMVCLIISINIQAQESRVPLQKQVRITNTLFSIDSLSTLITAQTGVFLSFNSNKIAAGQKVQTRKHSYTLAELLELIKSNTGSDYKIYKDHAIFHGGDVDKTRSATTAKVKGPSVAKSNKASEQVSAKSTTTTKAKSKDTTPLQSVAKSTTIASNQSSARSTTIAEVLKSNTTPRQSSAKSTITETKIKDTTSNQSPTKSTTITEALKSNTTFSETANNTISSFPLEPLTAKAPQMQKPSITLLSKPATIAQRATSSPQRTRWFADGGFTVDDVLYLNASITAGHQYLHGFFSWSSSFKVSGFRYGLGSMLPLNDEWRIGVMATTGKLSRNIDFSGVRDTLKNVTVKSELHRLAIQAEKSLSPNLVVKAGPVFNLLKSSYYQDGTPVTVATSGYEGTNGDREFYTVRPLYTLSNSYKATESTNTKTWIGFQVSLCYRFNF